MTQSEKMIRLIQILQEEMPAYARYEIPQTEIEQWNLLRALFNVRPPYPISNEFEILQNEVLQTILKDKGITEADSLSTTLLDSRIALWQGDITTLKVDAIMNAANNQMEGCWAVGHVCIDNNIHSFGGVQMRIECHRQMEELRNQYGDSYVQPTSIPMITPGYNLPAKNVIHVVGPIVQGPLNEEYKTELAQCYINSLEMAEENKCESIAFCCISTGIFMFPQDKAAEIAVKTVCTWLDEHPNTNIKKVIFNVFKDEDLRLYDAILNRKIRMIR